MKILQKARKFIAFLAAAAILIGMPGVCSLEASADGPVTYSVKYVPASKEWRYQPNTSTFDDKGSHKQLYYLRQELKEGDLVVVYNESESIPALDLGTTRLSNLTVTNSPSFIIIFSGNIDDCYLLDGASCSINGDVTNAYVYDNVLGNFNKNVKELNLYPASSLTGNIGCGGTVDHVSAVPRDTGRALYSLYSFPAGTFFIKDGALTTDRSKYSTAPSSAQAITKENFDYVRYANENPDVKAAFGLNAAALYRHYTTYGIKEGRAAYTVTKTGSGTGASEFNYILYADKNADLKAAFGYNAKALYNHYVTLGISEKRGNYSIYDTFDYLRYADDFADLKAAFGYDAKALYNHYVTCGMAEKRGNYMK